MLIIPGENNYANMRIITDEYKRMRKESFMARSYLELTHP